MIKSTNILYYRINQELFSEWIFHFEVLKSMFDVRYWILNNIEHRTSNTE